MNVHFILFTVIILFHLFFNVITDRCSQISDRESPVYKLSQRGKRSNGRLISRRRVLNLEDCEKFAIAKKALAFNYMEREDSRRRHRNDSNCQALECPVTNDFKSFVNDTRFNYYSIYRLKIQPENGSLRCLPKVGIFYESNESLNFTNAQKSCKRINGTLAHIVSEERTVGLGNIIQKSAVFVGMANQGKERHWKNEFDEPLWCFDYRGWDIGEPAHLRGCVVLSSKNHRSASWRVSPCSKKYPYICEITPRSHRYKNQHTKP